MATHMTRARSIVTVVLVGALGLVSCTQGNDTHADPPSEEPGLQSLGDEFDQLATEVEDAEADLRSALASARQTLDATSAEDVEDPTVLGLLEIAVSDASEHSPFDVPAKSDTLDGLSDQIADLKEAKSAADFLTLGLNDAVVLVEQSRATKLEAAANIDYSFVDAEGYSLKITGKIPEVSVVVDTVNAKPGEALLLVSSSVKLTLTNKTKGKNFKGGLNAGLRPVYEVSSPICDSNREGAGPDGLLLAQDVFLDVEPQHAGGPSDTRRVSSRYCGWMWDFASLPGQLCDGPAPVNGGYPIAEGESITCGELIDETAAVPEVEAQALAEALRPPAGWVMVQSVGFLDAGSRPPGGSGEWAWFGYNSGPKYNTSSNENLRVVWQSAGLDVTA
jgi:hypothetical protein